MQGKEKRTFERYPADLPAEALVVDGTGRWSCRVRDFCAEGMLLESAADDPFQRPGGLTARQTLRLQLALGEGRNLRRFVLAARVAHVNGRKAGVAMSRLDTALTRLLLDHSASLTAPQAETRAGSNGVPLGAGGAEALHNLIEATADRHLPAILREVVAQYEKDLVARAAVASAKDSAACENDLALFERGRATLLEVLAARLGELVKRLGAPSAAAKPGRPAAKRELTLMDEGALESWLAVADLVHTLETQLGAPLAAVQSGHARLARAEAAGVPFSPEAMGGLFHDLPDGTGIGPAARTPFVRVAGRVLSGRLEAFYQELAEGLQQLADDVAAREPREHEAPVLEPAERAYTPSEIIEALGVLQRQSAAAPDSRASGAIAGELAQVLGLQRPDAGLQVLGAQIEERLELADCLLDSIHGDARVPTAAGAWLGQLRLALVRAAVHEPTFHREGAHPVTRVAGQLEHLGLLVGEGCDDRGADTRAQVDALIAELLSRGLPESEDLERVSAALSALEERETADYQDSVAHVAAECEGEARVRAAREHVAAALDERLGGRPLPAPLVDLVTGGWEVLLQLTHIRHGVRSTEWAAAWQVLDDVETLLDRPPGTAGPEAAAALRAAVGAGVARFSFDPRQRAQLTGRLALCVEGDPACDPWQPPPRALLPPRRSAGPTGTTDEDAAPAGVTGDAWRALLERVAALGPCDPLAIADPTGTRRLRRVAWVDDDRTTFVLVDHRGSRAETLSRASLAAMLHAGTALLGEANGAALLDRAADSVLHAMAERVARDAWREPALGVYNRRHLTAAIVRAIRASRSAGRRPALIAVDLEPLDPIRQTHGAEVEAVLLRRLAALLQDRFGPPAVVAYIGDGAFGVLMESTEAAGIVAAAESLRVRIRDMPPPWANPPARVEASVGVAFIHPLHEQPEQVLAAAAAACGAAREAGRNQVAVRREDDSVILRRRSWMQSVLQLHDVLEEDRLRLGVQRVAPILSTGSGRSHHEVLMRVVAADGAELPLHPIIAAAENYNRMAIVDEAVVRKTLTWIGANPDGAASLGGFAIRLSADSLGVPDLVERVAKAFRVTGADPGQVCFGIAEELASADVERAAAVAHRLKALGCRFSLYDFGSGAAPQVVLQRLPVDLVRLDGAFVRNLVSSDRDYAVVKSINAMCHFLGRETLAPQVDSEAALACLRRIGVDYAQGYGIEAPRDLPSTTDERHAHVDSRPAAIALPR